MRKTIQRLFGKYNPRGDLLIEVMMAIVIIGVVLTAGYVLSNRGLNSSTNSEKRSQAQAIAQGQIERMANTEKTQPAELAKYTLKYQAFCITADGLVDSEDTQNPSYVCPNYDNDIGVGVTYNDATETFTVVAKWNVASGDPVQDRDSLTYDDQVLIYYKLPSRFTTSDYVLNTYLRGDGVGKITGSGINCTVGSGSDCAEAYSPAQSVNLTVTPAAGSVFGGWFGDCTGSASTCTVNVNKLAFVGAIINDTAPSGTLPPISGSSSGTGDPGMPPNCTCGTARLDANGKWYCRRSGSCGGGSSSNGGGSNGSSNGSTSSSSSNSSGGEAGGGSPPPPPSGCDFPPSVGSCVGCFVAGTLVDTPEGPKPIEQIKLGDVVNTWDTADNKMTPSTVVYTIKHESRPTLWIVTTGGGVVTTGVHRFWTDRGWMDAAALIPGKDKVLDDQGQWQTVMFRMYGSNQDVYNLHVENSNHDFFANGFLVHNNKIH